jgi:hypothetical protein
MRNAWGGFYETRLRDTLVGYSSNASPTGSLLKGILCGIFVLIGKQNKVPAPPVCGQLVLAGSLLW